MTADKLLVTIFGGGLVGLIWWFFFGKKEEFVEAKEKIEVVVEGGYKPANIKLAKNKRMILRITRRDPNSCLEEIIIPEFKVRQYLPLGKTIEISITPQKEGEFEFHCGMNMYHGKIVVE